MAKAIIFLIFHGEGNNTLNTTPGLWQKEENIFVLTTETNMAKYFLFFVAEGNKTLRPYSQR